MAVYAPECVFDAFVTAQVQIDFGMFDIWLQGFSEQEAVLKREQEVVQSQGEALRVGRRKHRRIILHDDSASSESSDHDSDSSSSSSSDDEIYDLVGGDVDDSEATTNMKLRRLVECCQRDVADQYRNLEILQEYLEFPRMLKPAHCCYLLTPLQRCKLITDYYAFDSLLMRCILGKKLDMKANKIDPERLSNKCMLRQKVCQRHLDNLRRIADFRINDPQSPALLSDTYGRNRCSVSSLSKLQCFLDGAGYSESVHDGDETGSGSAADPDISPNDIKDGIALHDNGNNHTCREKSEFCHQFQSIKLPSNRTDLRRLAASSAWALVEGIDYNTAHPLSMVDVNDSSQSTLAASMRFDSKDDSPSNSKGHSSHTRKGIHRASSDLIVAKLAQRNTRGGEWLFESESELTGYPAPFLYQWAFLLPSTYAFSYCFIVFFCRYRFETSSKKFALDCSFDDFQYFACALLREWSRVPRIASKLYSYSPLPSKYTSLSFGVDLCWERDVKVAESHTCHENEPEFAWLGDDELDENFLHALHLSFKFVNTKVFLDHVVERTFKAVSTKLNQNEFEAKVANVCTDVSKAIRDVANGLLQIAGSIEDSLRSLFINLYKLVFLPCVAPKHKSKRSQLSNERFMVSAFVDEIAAATYILVFCLIRIFQRRQVFSVIIHECCASVVAALLGSDATRSTLVIHVPARTREKLGMPSLSSAAVKSQFADYFMRFSLAIIPVLLRMFDCFIRKQVTSQ